MSNDKGTSRERLDLGKWMIVYLPLTEFLTCQEVLLLCFLINQQQRWHQEDREAWFYCQVKTVQAAIRSMDKKGQSRWLKGLQHRGFISVKKLPRKPKTRPIRWVQIHYDVIEKALDDLDK